MIEIYLTNTCPPDLAELSRRSEGFTHYASRVQLDIDDAKFAPVLSWPYYPGQWEELQALADRKALPYADQLYYEAHLMVNEPVEVGVLLARAGIRRILPHVEPLMNPEAVEKAFAAYKAAGAEEVGLSLLMETPLSVLDPVIASCDAVQLMGIRTLGAQGAPFDPEVISRVKELHAKYPDLTISIDGGVSENSIVDLVRAGARRFGVGSAIMKKPDPAGAYQQILELAQSAL